MSRLKTALLAAAVLTGASSLAYAQMSAAYDPAQLPTVKGKVAQYLPTPRGDVDGLLLDDGTEVHMPPHMSSQLVFAVHPGDAVTIHGLKARAATMVAAASITNDATNITVTDAGPREGAAMQAQGKVKAVLHGMRGELNGVVLDDGTVVRLPPPEAQRLADQLAVGKTLVVHGEGVASPFGKSLGAREIGPDAAHLVAVAAPRPGWEHWAHEHFGHHPHGPGMHGEGMRGEGMDHQGPPPPPAQ
jgi:hypothetical protein